MKSTKTNYMEDQTPQALCAEIEKFERFLALAESGIIKITKSKKKRIESYVSQVKKVLFEITKEGIEDISDDDLMKELELEII